MLIMWQCSIPSNASKGLPSCRKFDNCHRFWWYSLSLICEEKHHESTWMAAENLYIHGNAMSIFRGRWLLWLASKSILARKTKFMICYLIHKGSAVPLM